jgi:hypothetical protein
MFESLMFESLIYLAGHHQQKAATASPGEDTPEDAGQESEEAVSYVHVASIQEFMVDQDMNEFCIGGVPSDERIFIDGLPWHVCISHAWQQYLFIMFCFHPNCRTAATKA